MDSYRQYWLITGLLVTAVVYAVSQGLIGWLVVKFPGIEVRLVSIVVVGIFLYTYIVDGWAAAALLSRSESVLRGLESGGHPEAMRKSLVSEILIETRDLRQNSISDGSTRLYDIQSEGFIDRLMDGMARLDFIRMLLFYLGLFFTLVAIVISSPINIFRLRRTDAILLHDQTCGIVCA